MKLRAAALLTVSVSAGFAVPTGFAVLAGCSYRHRFVSSSVETAMPRTWFLVAAPFTREFPRGNIHEPLSLWAQVTTYDSAERCDAVLMQAEDQLQRPVSCVASDDPRMKEQAAALQRPPVS